MLNIKPKADCKWELISLGEVLLRFDPGDDRIHNARTFRVWEGGGEYNVARNLAKCFRLKTAIVTALADNQIGRLVEDLIQQGGADVSQILWRETDGISGASRNGMYFMERGFGPRPPTGCSDRANTAVSQLKRGEIDWSRVFGEKGVRWFHTGGIFAGLSQSTAQVAAEAMQAARSAGTIVSYDLNYRASLWSDRGGRDAANQLNRDLLKHADVVFGVEDFDAALSRYSEDDLRRAADAMRARYPNIRIVATTLRDIHSSSSHSISGVCFDGEIVDKAADHRNCEVLDRVGSGDAFAAGLIYGLLSGATRQRSIGLAAASCVLAMTSPGDGLAATLAEIERTADGSGNGTIR